MATSQLLEPISELADYSALKKLADALWRQDTAYHGAAIMVGAGFSRSAAVSGDPKRKLRVLCRIALARNLRCSRRSEVDLETYSPRCQRLDPRAGCATVVDR